MSATLISVADLRRMRVDDPALRMIDVRTGGEYQSSHIAGSYNVPLGSLGEHASELATLDHPVVLVCQSGARASNAHETLDSAGKTGLYVLDGGMNAWASAGEDVNVGATTRWAMDRQVRLVAGALVLLAVIASVVVPGAKWIAAGVGAGLTYSALTNTCAMAAMLAKLPYNKVDSCDIDAMLAQLHRTDA